MGAVQWRRRAREAERGGVRPFGAPESRRGGKLDGKINILNKKIYIYFLLSTNFELLN
jgi:hypothetical protein